MRLRPSQKLPLALLGAGVGFSLVSAIDAQLPPSRPARIGQIELVASLRGDQPAGIAISNTGRMFITFPRHDGNVAFTVGELKDGVLSAFPSSQLNHAAEDQPAASLFSVQTACVDSLDHLWMLDSGTLKFGEPPLPGAAKLMEFDLKLNRLLHTFVIPSRALVQKSALKDFRVDIHRGQGGTAFITDSAPEGEGLIVMDLASGNVLRRLTAFPGVRAQPGRTPIVGFLPLLEIRKDDPQGVLKPWLVGLNALELSANGQTVFFSAFTGRRLYSVSAEVLSNSQVNDNEVSTSISELGDIGMAGHFVLDTKGSIYFMDMEQNAIYRRTSEGRVELVVTDPRLMWPDTMALGKDRFLYVTTSQHDMRPEFHDGRDLRQLPYGVYRVRILADPVLMDGR